MIEIPEINSVSEFFARALAIEVEAAERYEMLADQMEVHNNRRIAEIFRKMAKVESEHRTEIARRAGNALVDGKAAQFSWIRPDGPEAIDFADLHYKMTPRQALQLARLNEERAARYFEAIAANATDSEIAAFAATLAEDERQHLAWVDRWIEKCSPDDPDWDEDLDPPVLSD